MVKLLNRVSFCLGLLLLCQNIYASPGLEAKLSAERLELGKPVWLQIRTSSTAPPLHTIDLGAVKQHFYIDKPIEDDTGTTQQSWKWRLYPYTLGIKNIPELNFNGLTSKPLQLNVTPAIDGKTRTEISLAGFISKQRPWMREQVLFSYHAKTGIPRAQFRIGSPDNSNFIIQPLETEQTSDDSGERQVYHYKSGWAFFPIRHGKQTITLPPLELVRDGVMTHRFFHKPLRLDVKSLPAYLPATIPVGKTDLRVARPYRLFFQDNLENLQLSVVGSNTPARSLPDIRNQFTGSADLRIYPDVVTRKQDNLHSGIISRIDYRIPVKATGQGITTTGNIKVSYFDPVSGTLETSQYSGITIFVINKWLAGLLMVILVALVAYPVIRLARKLVGYIEKHRGYRKSIKSLIKSNDISELRKALAYAARAEGYTHTMTLPGWYNTVVKVPKADDQHLLNLANELFYKTRDPAGFAEVRQGMIKLMLRNAPWPRLPVTNPVS